VLSREGGKRYELVDVRFAGVTAYRTSRVHREVTLRVRDAGGAETDLRVCGSMIEQDGAWKVFSYVVAD
jgi:anaerobic glycerol-3-phosphate dehydrogenase